MAKKKKVNPHRIPLPKKAINREQIIEEAMKDNMDHAWLLLAGPLLDDGYKIAPLMEAVNTYTLYRGDKNKNRELERAQIALGLPYVELDGSKVKSPVALEAFKRKAKKIAEDTALCVLYLGLEKEIETDKLKAIFFSADLTRAEIEHGLTTYEDLERELISREAGLGKDKIEELAHR